MVSQLNVFRDEKAILRVKCKLKRWRDPTCDLPILLSKRSKLVTRIILDLHAKLGHSGVYSVLAEFRKTFWISHGFSLASKCLRSCVKCRRFNNRTVKRNQSPNRDFRINPPNIPFRYLFVDYFGPYFIRLNGMKSKVSILCFTCLWSRAISLEICLDLSVTGFIRAFQLHTFKWGTPTYCCSDLGSQIVPATNIIKDFIRDPETVSYFVEHGVRPLKLEEYPKGCKQLGALIESSVKLVKILIYGSIGKSVLDFRDFELLIAQTINIVNRRPIAFKEGLRENSVGHEVPCPNTPEMLLHGYELISINLVPDLQQDADPDASWDNVVEPTEHTKYSYD